MPNCMYCGTWTEDKRNKMCLPCVPQHISTTKKEYYEKNRKTVEERYWKKIDKNPKNKGPNGDCWGWLGDLHDWGYGRLFVKGKKEFAHRISYQIHKGKVPEDMHIRHLCHNPPCTNPEHLLIGTHKDNMRDMSEAKRSIFHKIDQTGSNNVNAVLTENQIKTGVDLYINTLLTAEEISNKLKISVDALRAVLRGVTWAHVTGFKKINRITERKKPSN